ncbi:pyrroloquinoline quinone biosynthesis peptide chaperone PqqD [Streptomyces sp. NPDC003362]
MTEATGTDWRPVLAPGALRRHDPVRDALLLLLPERVGVLTGHGGEIVELCDGTRSVRGIVDTLADRFPGAPVGTDVPPFLERLREEGWLR